MTTELERGEWSAARPGRTLPPGKSRCTLYTRLSGPLIGRYPPINIEQTECSETSAYKIQTPGNYSEERVQD